MKYNILVTGGGTTEPIDSVRSISNTSTGRLGAAIADAFAEKSDCNVCFLHAKGSALPKSEKVSLFEIGTVADLENAVRKLSSELKPDAVIHSMAVSDYRTVAVTTAGELAKRLDGIIADEQTVVERMKDLSLTRDGGKLSSGLEYPLILMERTPKILPQLRSLMPGSVIVGFKLLSNVPHEQLIQTAEKLLKNNGCNFVLANDAGEITGDQHIGYLLDSDGKEQKFGTKKEIACGIADAVIKEVRK